MRSDILLSRVPFDPSALGTQEGSLAFPNRMFPISFQQLLTGWGKAKVGGGSRGCWLQPCDEQLGKKSKQGMISS